MKSLIFSNKNRSLHKKFFIQVRKKLFYGGGCGRGSWVKMLTTMVGQWEKKLKNTLAETPFSSLPKKTKFETNYKWFKSSYLKFFFWKYFFGHTTFLRTFQWTSEFFLDFRFSNRKSQSQQKLAKKITHFSIRFNSNHLIYFINLNSLDVENNILPKQ